MLPGTPADSFIGHCPRSDQKHSARSRLKSGTCPQGWFLWACTSLLSCISQLRCLVYDQTLSRRQRCGNSPEQSGYLQLSLMIPWMWSDLPRWGMPVIARRRSLDKERIWPL
jgi:hypothetical protein